MDASVISKVFLNEEYAEKVRQIISMHDKKELTIEDVVYLGDLV